MRLLLAIQESLRKAGLWLACGLLFVIMLLGSADALTSSLFNAPIPSMLELSETMLSASVFLALASVSSQHVRVDILVERFSPNGQALCTALALAVGLLVFAGMAWRFWGLAIDSIEVGETAAALLPFPIWPAKTLAAIGVTMAATQCLLDLVTLPSRGIHAQREA
jgi:TRAP-type mannitol/chloroaromatic compound transport system permease small subunit